MIWMGLVIILLGLLGVLIRPNLPGVLIGVQTIFLGAGLLFVTAGALSGRADLGHSIAIFIVIGGLVQMVMGWAISVRLHHKRKNVQMSDLNELRQ